MCPVPRMLSGPPLGITGGHCDNNLPRAGSFNSSADGVADGIEAAQTKCGRASKTALISSRFAPPVAYCHCVMTRKPRRSPQEMKAIVADAHRLGLKSCR